MEGKSRFQNDNKRKQMNERDHDNNKYLLSILVNGFQEGTNY